MALTNINTGYTPEFALGAMYAGENAATNRMGNQLEIVKNFLANQREQQMQPLDIDKARLANEGTVFDNMKKNLEGNQALVQNTVPMLRKFRESKEADYNKNIRQDELDSLMQPFKKEAVPSQGQAMLADMSADAQLAGERQRILSMPDGPERRAAAEQYSKNVATRGYTPDFWGKNEVENTKGYWDLEKANIAASATRDAAHVGGKAAWAQAIGPATQEVSKLRELMTKLDNNELTDEIATRVRMSGKKPGTPEYKAALVSEKDMLRKALTNQLTQAQQWLFDVQRASGIQQGAPIPASTSNSSSSSGRVIKLD